MIRLQLLAPAQNVWLRNYAIHICASDVIQYLVLVRFFQTLFSESSE